MSRPSPRLAALAALACLALAPALRAQQPAPRPPREMNHDVMTHDMDHDMGPGMRRRQGPGGPGMGAPRGGIASLLLGQTAELKLTDAQVTRLAALARSAEAQQEAMRPAMDSMHRAMMSAPRGGAPMQPTPAMESRMKAMHDQMHANVRDALGVLTPDQLATAWEMRGGMGGPMAGPARMRPAGAMRMREPGAMRPAMKPEQ